MADYRLSRARSAAIVRSNSMDSRPSVLLTRTYSVPDVTAYFRSSLAYKPQWPSYYNSSRSSWVYPYRYHKDYSLYDDYWYDKYYNFSPLYHRSMFPRRYYHSDYIPNPYYWNAPYTYWTRYKGYLYDYDTSLSLRRYNSPYYDSHYGYGSYLSTYYSPYRSLLMSSMADSLDRGLELFRKGVINFSGLNGTWLSRSSWDTRFKDYSLLYYPHKYPGPCAPSSYTPRPLQYATCWS